MRGTGPLVVSWVPTLTPVSPTCIEDEHTSAARSFEYESAASSNLSAHALHGSCEELTMSELARVSAVKPRDVTIYIVRCHGHEF